MAQCFEKFWLRFSVTQEYFWDSFIFENPCFTFDINHQNYLKKTFFTDNEFLVHGNIIKNLTLKCFLNREGQILNREEFVENTGINISVLKYNRLRGLVTTSIRKYSKPDLTMKKQDKIENFCMRIKKGSKKFRKILSETPEPIVSSNILRFSEITEIVINAERSQALNSLWNKSFFDTSMRTFIFKFYNNLLGTNSRVAHFVRNHPSTCTFCDISRNPFESQESVKHLFFECEHVERLLQGFYSWLLNEPPIDVIGPVAFFGGFNFDNVSKNYILNIVGAI